MRPLTRSEYEKCVVRILRGSRRLLNVFVFHLQVHGALIDLHVNTINPPDVPARRSRGPVQVLLELRAARRPNRRPTTVACSAHPLKMEKKNDPLHA